MAWQNPDSRVIAPVGLLQHDQAEYRFRYLRRAPEVPGFTGFVSFPDWEKDHRSPRLFPLFSQRVMSPRRPDYVEFLRQLHLTPDAEPWEQLARSGGRRVGDTVQLFPIPTVEPDGRTECLFLVHGARYVAGEKLPPLTAGDTLALRDDPDNPINPAAVLVQTATSEPLGYVPDLLLDYLSTVRQVAPPTVTAEHVNGPEVPPHLWLLVRMTGQAPPGYQPMTGGRWATF